MPVRTLAWAVATVPPIEVHVEDDPPHGNFPLENSAPGFYTDPQFYIILVLLFIVGQHTFKFRRFYIEIFRVLLWAAASRDSNYEMCVTLQTRTGQHDREIAIDIAHYRNDRVGATELSEIEIAPANAAIESESALTSVD